MLTIIGIEQYRVQAKSVLGVGFYLGSNGELGDEIILSILYYTLTFTIADAVLVLPIGLGPEKIVVVLWKSDTWHVNNKLCLSTAIYAASHITNLICR